MISNKVTSEAKRQAQNKHKKEGAWELKKKKFEKVY